MTAEERHLAQTLLAESRERWLDLLSCISPAQLAFKPSPDRWSIAENLEHVILVERRACGFAENALKQAPDRSRTSGYPGAPEGLIAMLRDRSHPRGGPEQIQPTGRWPHDQLASIFEDARQHTFQVLADSAESDLHAHFAPHPLFGDLDCYQWLIVVGAHGDRHRAQSEEVMADPQFPRAAAAP